MTSTSPYLGIQDRSLASVLRGTTSEVRRGLMIEEEHPFGAPGLPGPARIRTSLEERSRLIPLRWSSPGELYDHNLDRGELLNIHDEPEGDKLRFALTEAMTHELVEPADRGRAPTASA